MEKLRKASEVRVEEQGWRLEVQTQLVLMGVESILVVRAKTKTKCESETWQEWVKVSG